MKKIVVFFIFCLNIVAPLYGVNGQNRAALKQFLQYAVQRISERIAVHPKAPKKVIVVPPYSILHSFKSDFKGVKMVLETPVHGLAFIIQKMGRANNAAQAVAIWLRNYALQVSSGALIALTLFVLYKALYADDEYKQYRLMALSVPSSLVLAYPFHKLIQYLHFKQKYRQLIAANR
jgi:hypothetical protein